MNFKHFKMELSAFKNWETSHKNSDFSHLAHQRHTSYVTPAGPRACHSWSVPEPCLLHARETATCFHQFLGYLCWVLWVGPAHVPWPELSTPFYSASWRIPVLVIFWPCLVDLWTLTGFQPESKVLHFHSSDSFFLWFRICPDDWTHGHRLTIADNFQSNEKCMIFHLGRFLVATLDLLFCSLAHDSSEAAGCIRAEAFNVIYHSPQ